MKNRSKTLFASLALVLLSSSAFAGIGDTHFPIYGKAAEKLLQSGLLKPASSTSTCYTVENPIDANGDTVDVIHMRIQGVKIDSIICYYVGQTAAACEASDASAYECP